MDYDRWKLATPPHYEESKEDELYNEIEETALNALRKAGLTEMADFLEGTSHFESAITAQLNVRLDEIADQSIPY